MATFAAPPSAATLSTRRSAVVWRSAVQARRRRATPVVARFSIEVLPSIRDVSAAEWHSVVTPADSPFLYHDFLAALEDTGCATPDTGWTPRHILLRDVGDDDGGSNGSGGEEDTSSSPPRPKNELVGVAVAYQKAHSYGEFVFDGGWADASESAGIPYYPKLQVGPPFSPVPGRRLLVPPSHPRADELRAALAAALIQVAKALRLSSVHVTFVEAADLACLEGFGFLHRLGTRLEWTNAVSTPGPRAGCPYTNYGDFLGDFRSKKRSKMLRERRAVTEGAGLDVRVLEGSAIPDAALDAMYSLYRATLLKKWPYGRQYLTRAFFDALKTNAWKQHLVLALAYRRAKAGTDSPAARRDGDEDAGTIVAGTLSVVNHETGVLSGRYWGAVEDIPHAHFELCYAAPVEWAISRGLRVMEAGAGGEESKSERGFEAVPSSSAHWVAHRGLREAVRVFLQEERRAVGEVVAVMEATSKVREKGRVAAAEAAAAAARGGDAAGRH